MSPIEKLAHRDRLLVRTAELREDGYLDDADATRIALVRTGDGTAREIAWPKVRHISRRTGPDRMWWIPVLLAVVLGGLLGVVGWFFDSLGGSTPGEVHTPLAVLAAVLGMAAGAAIGTVIAFAAAGPWWEPVYQAPDGVEPEASQPVDERMRWGKVPGESRDAALADANRVSYICRGILVVICLVIWAFCFHWR